MFNNQTIVITGGASGIGLEVANAVVQNNGTALIIDNNNETLGKLRYKLRVSTNCLHTSKSKWQEKCLL